MECARPGRRPDARLGAALVVTVALLVAMTPAHAGTGLPVQRPTAGSSPAVMDVICPEIKDEVVVSEWSAAVGHPYSTDSVNSSFRRLVLIKVGGVAERLQSMALSPQDPLVRLWMAATAPLARSDFPQKGIVDDVDAVMAGIRGARQYCAVHWTGDDNRDSIPGFSQADAACTRWNEIVWRQDWTSARTVAARRSIVKQAQAAARANPRWKPIASAISRMNSTPKTSSKWSSLYTPVMDACSKVPG